MLDSISKYFIEDLCIYSHQPNRYMVFFSGIFLSGFGFRVMLASWKRLKAFLPSLLYWLVWGGWSLLWSVWWSSAVPASSFGFIVHTPAWPPVASQTTVVLRGGSIQKANCSLTPRLKPPLWPRARAIPWQCVGRLRLCLLEFQAAARHPADPTGWHYIPLLTSALSYTCCHCHVSNPTSLHSTGTTPFFSFPPLHLIFVHCTGAWLSFAAPWLIVFLQDIHINY